MKNIGLTMAISLMVFATPVAFANTQTSTNSTVTNSTTAPTTVIDNNGNQTTQSTTNSTSTSTTKNVNIDDEIKGAIYSKYAKDAALIGTSLTVDSKDGSVTISGTVTAQSQADEAVIAAKSIKGVQSVRSDITVTTNSTNNNTVKKPNY